MKQRYHILSLLLFTVSISFGTHAQDSIASKRLDEILVTAKRGWVEDGKIIFVPTKKEKKLSNSPSSLIESMNLPMLNGGEGGITNLGGQPVAVFINGEKTTDIDISTFWPKHVKRVEYIENPSDPKYEGARVAVNFIMTEYEVGGVTSLDAGQKLPTNGFYEAASKLVYKRMTYGAMVRGSYSRDHRESASGITTYKDLFYDGEKYDEIKYIEESRTHEREQGLDFALNAKYSTDKFYATHSVNLALDRNPGSGTESTGTWTDNLFGSDYSYFSDRERSVSPQMYGLYFGKLSDKWSLSGAWSYLYTRNHRSSESQIGDTDPIYNGTAEDVNRLRFEVRPSFRHSGQWFFLMDFQAVMKWFSTDYSGSTQAKQRQASQDLTAYFKVYYMPTQQFQIVLTPGIAANLRKIGEIASHTVTPTGTADIWWGPSSKYSMSGSVNFYMRSASPSESNPVTVRESQLLWVKGNPELKALTSWSGSLYSYYMPCNMFSLSWGANYNRTFNDIISKYESAPQDMGGLIKTNFNSAPDDYFNTHISLTGRFLDSDLTVRLTPSLYYWRYHGPVATSFKSVDISASVSYSLGNVRMNLDYNGPYKGLENGGMGKSWIQDSWDGRITYGVGDLYLAFKMENIFNSRAKRWSKYTTPNFSTDLNRLVTGRKFLISVTYTFGYGKEVDDNIDISGSNKTESSVIK